MDLVVYCLDILEASIALLTLNDMRYFILNMNAKRIDPIHLGEILLEEFLQPMKICQNPLAMDIHVPARRINEIVHGKRRISADTALRLGRFFNNSPQFWLGLQMDYDLDVAEDKLNDRLDREIQPFAA